MAKRIGLLSRHPQHDRIMTFDPTSLPIDTQGELVGARAVMHNALLESMRSGKVDKVLSSKRTQQRAELLSRKMHVVGTIALPIPNVVAQQLIERLDITEMNRFTCETIFILTHQMHEDILFLEGLDRERAIAKVVKQIHAHELPLYYIAIREMLDMLEKKTASYSTKMQSRMAGLMQQLNSSSSPKPTANPSATGSTN